MTIIALMDRGVVGIVALHTACCSIIASPIPSTIDSSVDSCVDITTIIDNRYRTIA